MGSTRKHVDFKEIYLYKDDIDEEAWETLLDKLDIHEPVTAVCLTVSQWEMLLNGGE